MLIFVHVCRMFFRASEYRLHLWCSPYDLDPMTQNDLCGIMSFHQHIWPCFISVLEAAGLLLGDFRVCQKNIGGVVSVKWCNVRTSVV